MKKTLRIIGASVLTVLLAGQLLAGIVLKGLAASPKNGSVSVVWQTVDETNVVRFEVWRAHISQGKVQEFALVGSVDPLGAGRSYEVIDDAAYKLSSNVFAYKVRVVFQDGTSAYSEVVKTAALSSAAKRTWGSIKAMFR